MEQLHNAQSHEALDSKAIRLATHIIDIDPAKINTSTMADVHAAIAQYNSDLGGHIVEEEMLVDEQEEGQNSLNDDKWKNPQAKRSTAPSRKNSKKTTEP